MMSVLSATRPEVVEASDDELRRAVRHALEGSGYTFEELAAQARTGRFESLRARMAWVAIGDLGDLAS